MPSSPMARSGPVTAVLGPTNTGKTHLAIERMLAFPTGVIGLPLRLLAREVYARICAKAGEKNVALLTGEERICPEQARYQVCTVEAMPPDLAPSFLAIDEIQLCADLDRGHIFTDRILNARGRDETLLLGAATMRPMIETLLPQANILQRPRLSHLTFAGERKITRLPRRAAIVAFSAEEVYTIAEFIRRQKGGAAVVLGALSPRTRNAQVEMYQSGEVDYLVATDAIGMGLNLDIDHVAFAGRQKFDGYSYRDLTPAELGQIAGRAGRAMRDGTFGTTGRCPPFDPELVETLEKHTFAPVRLLQWRNSDLEFSTLDRLQATLMHLPAHPALTRAPLAEDLQVLDMAARTPETRALATTPEAIARLWEVCRLPDYRKTSLQAHAELVMTVFGFLRRQGAIPQDWFAAQIAQNDHTGGDIDTLSARIAHARTWAFIANRADWVDNAPHWQGVTRALEDRLSDALHERLTQRFVDRRTNVLMRHLRDNEMMQSEVTSEGTVMVEGHTIGQLQGLRFVPDPGALGEQARTLEAAARTILAGELRKKADRIQQAPDDAFILSSEGVLRWQGEIVGRLGRGDTLLHPRMHLLADEELSGEPRSGVQQRLDLWLKTHVTKLLGPLLALETTENLTGLARGIAFRLVESLGVLDRLGVLEDVRALDQEMRTGLRQHGVRFGAYHLYLPLLLKPAPRALATRLWALYHELDTEQAEPFLALAQSGRTSFPAATPADTTLYRIAGFRLCGPRAVRVDILERLADLIRPALSWRPHAPGEKPDGAVDGRSFTVTGAMTSLVGAGKEDFSAILMALGYRMEQQTLPPVPPAEPSETTQETEPLKTESQEADPQASADTDTAPPLSAPEEAQTPTQDETPSQADSSHPEQTSQAPQEPPLPAPPQTIEVWRPGRTLREDQASGQKTQRPEKHRPGQHRTQEASSSQPQPARHRHKFKKHARTDDQRPSHTREKPKPPEKPMDPDSPFAKLLALKQQMSEKQ